jgi:type VI secretion system protein ImpH
MATAGGSAAYALESRLREKPSGLGFFQAVRRLECAYRGLSRIGGSEHPKDDPVRFCQTTSLAFPPGAISKFVPAEDEHPARLFVNFMGLLGSNGPMPLAVSEYVYDRIHNHEDATLARFLDIFNHRMVSLFYRAWANSQLTVSRDRPSEHGYDRYVGSIFGMGMSSFLNEDCVPDEAKRHYSGRLAATVRNAEGLQSILSDYLRVPARVVQFVGRWMPIPEQYRCLLGERPDSGRLGMTALLGARTWDCQQKFRIVLGPMSLADYERLLPHTSSFRRLVDWVRDYVGDELLWDAQLILRAADVPRVRLGSYGHLGRTTWLASHAPERDAADKIVDESCVEMVKHGAGRDTPYG